MGKSTLETSTFGDLIIEKQRQVIERAVRRGTTGRPREEYQVISLTLDQIRHGIEILERYEDTEVETIAGDALRDVFKVYNRTLRS